LASRTGASNTRRILIVDDDAAIRTSIADALVESGTEVRVAALEHRAFQSLRFRVRELRRPVAAIAAAPYAEPLRVHISARC